MPLLKEFYEKYKNQKLKILSISVDTDRKKWTSAIKKLQLDWEQGSDLQGNGRGAAFAYGLRGVPLYILISPEGRIVEKSLGGDIILVESKIREIFNSNRQ